MIRIRIGKKSGNFVILRLQEFIVGEEYWFGYGRNLKKTRFIQTTPKGYNFLDLEKSKVLLMRGHLYPDKSFQKPNHFFVPDRIQITKIDKTENLKHDGSKRKIESGF